MKWGKEDVAYFSRGEENDDRKWLRFKSECIRKSKPRKKWKADVVTWGYEYIQEEVQVLGALWEVPCPVLSAHLSKNSIYTVKKITQQRSRLIPVFSGKADALLWWPPQGKSHFLQPMSVFVVLTIIQFVCPHFTFCLDSSAQVYITKDFFKPYFRASIMIVQ